jgi:hypothetical protein
LAHYGGPLLSQQRYGAIEIKDGTFKGASPEAVIDDFDLGQLVHEVPAAG